VAQDVSDLFGLEHEVDRHHDRAPAGQRKAQRGKTVRVARQHRHLVALGHADAGQACGQARDQRIELGIGPGGSPTNDAGLGGQADRGATQGIGNGLAANDRVNGGGDSVRHVQGSSIDMIGRLNTRPARIPLALPLPSPRKLSHTRTVVYQGYDREDGLWDIEAQLTDVKTFGFQVPNERLFPGDEPIHNLKIRVTLDNKMVIQDIATSMDDIPHAECSGAPHNMHKLIGCTMGPGWRKIINQHVGGTDGCTHLREMLFNMATAAYQTLPAANWRASPTPK